MLRIFCEEACTPRGYEAVTRRSLTRLGWRPRNSQDVDAIVNSELGVTEVRGSRRWRRQNSRTLSHYGDQPGDSAAGVEIDIDDRTTATLELAANLSELRTVPGPSIKHTVDIRRPHPPFSATHQGSPDKGLRYRWHCAAR